MYVKTSIGTAYVGYWTTWPLVLDHLTWNEKP